MIHSLIAGTAADFLDFLSVGWVSGAILVEFRPPGFIGLSAPFEGVVDVVVVVSWDSRRRGRRRRTDLFGRCRGRWWEGLRRQDLLATREEPGGAFRRSRRRALAARGARLGLLRQRVDVRGRVGGAVLHHQRGVQDALYDGAEPGLKPHVAVRVGRGAEVRLWQQREFGLHRRIYAAASGGVGVEQPPLLPLLDHGLQRRVHRRRERGFTEAGHHHRGPPLLRSGADLGD
mmetsp:Transcript_11546/g.35879  ORF Transcript_11546/g.35879 Transcript_11546/m.35879 type:complete len:231 (-) Transcript_11546:212-904(-)